MAAASLVAEDLRAMPRARFGLLGAFFLLCAATSIAVAAAGTAGLKSAFLLPVFGLAPILLAPLAATSFAHARSSGFVVAIFSTPVSATRYYWSRILLWTSVGLLYLLAVSPLALVIAHHLGFAVVAPYLLLGMLLSVFSAVVGSLLGTLVPDRGALTAGTISALVALASLLAASNVEQATRLSPAAGGAALLRLLHAAPPVLAMDAVGAFTYVRPLAPSRAAVLLAAGLTLSAVLGWVVFTRLQSPMSWEASPGFRALAVVAALLLFCAPAALASVSYEEERHVGAEPSQYYSDAIVVQVVGRGEAPVTKRFAFLPDIIAANHANEVDVLVFLYPGSAAEPFTDFRVQLEGKGLDVGAYASQSTQAAQLERGPPYAGAPVLPFIRIPTDLTPDAPIALAGNPHALQVQVDYQTATGPAKGAAVVRIESAVMGAPVELGLAGAPVCMAVLVMFVARRRWR